MNLLAESSNRGSGLPLLMTYDPVACRDEKCSSIFKYYNKHVLTWKRHHNEIIPWMKCAVNVRLLCVLDRHEKSKHKFFFPLIKMK